MSITTFEWINFSTIILIIGIVIYFLIKTRKSHKPQKVDDPENPLNSVFKHWDDL